MKTIIKEAPANTIHISGVNPTDTILVYNKANQCIGCLVMPRNSLWCIIDGNITREWRFNNHSEAIKTLIDEGYTLKIH